jgi:amino acid permease
MIIYLSICYVFMAAIALVISGIDSRSINYKDWILWLTAPVSLPIFILFYIYYKNKTNSNQHEDDHSSSKGYSDKLPGYW